MQQPSSSGLRSTKLNTEAGNRRLTCLQNAIPEMRGWDLQELEELLNNSVSIEVPANTVLIRPESICESFIIILEGTVRVYQNAKDGRELTLYRINPGDLCVMSLSSLLKERRFNAIAVSETPIVAISISRSQFLGLIARHESFAVRILDSLTDHFSKAMDLMEDLVFNRLESRLACLLGSLFEASSGSPVKITHQELANELGSTREVVSRLLKTLEREGCISLSRGCINLSGPDSPSWFRRNRT